MTFQMPCDTVRGIFSEKRRVKTGQNWTKLPVRCIMNLDHIFLKRG